MDRSIDSLVCNICFEVVNVSKNFLKLRNNIFDIKIIVQKNIFNAYVVLFISTKLKRSKKITLGYFFNRIKIREFF